MYVRVRYVLLACQALSPAEQPQHQQHNNNNNNNIGNHACCVVRGPLQTVQVFDMFVWLARRFPEEFYDLEHAQDGLEASQALIEQSLHHMAAKPRRRRKQRAQQRRHGSSDDTATREDAAGNSAVATEDPTEDDAEDVLSLQLRSITAPPGSPAYLRQVRDILDQELDVPQAQGK